MQRRWRHARRVVLFNMALLLCHSCVITESNVGYMPFRALEEFMSPRSRRRLCGQHVTRSPGLT
jgi:hypothetical protein